MVMSGLKVENLCPVCGYEMEEPAAHYNICSSCGTEFGLNDVNVGILQLQQNWVAGGMRWWSQSDPQPENWNPLNQLERVFTGVLSGSSNGAVTVQWRDEAVSECMQPA